MAADTAILDRQWDEVELTEPVPGPGTTVKGVSGVLAEFESPEALKEASRRVREAGFTSWDAHSPFPVHGLERDMGLKKSRVAWFVLILGLSGAAAGMLLQWWVSAVAYPLVISGKPFFSWPAFVPIMFECGILGGAVGALFGFLILARLPQHHFPFFRSRRFDRVTDDKFFISVEARDPRFSLERLQQLFEDLGASHVEILEP
ncbi:MAG: DUF3341 domain-containing protein [Acidobacteriota bacterium]